MHADFEEKTVYFVYSFSHVRAGNGVLFRSYTVAAALVQASERSWECLR